MTNYNYKFLDLQNNLDSSETRNENLGSCIIIIMQFGSIIYLTNGRRK